MRSLFIVSLPRSLSSQVHARCCDALGLRGPAWTSDGEILNIDRSVLSAGRGVSGHKFILPQQRSFFAAASEFLAHVVAPDGFAYKDVVQPFVVAAWLRQHPEVPVLKIVPNIAHVAHAMIGRSWLYPSVAGIRGSALHERLVSGLVEAARTLDGVPGETVAYDDLIFDLEPLRQALGRLYPDVPIGPVGHEPGFAHYRDEVIRRRDLDTFALLRQTERAMRAPH